MAAAQSDNTAIPSLGPWEPGDEVGVFSPAELDGLEAFYLRYGFAVLRGAMSDEAVAAVSTECIAAQERLIAGSLPDRYGTTELIKSDASDTATPFANYVTHITELSPSVDALLDDPLIVDTLARWLGPTSWSAREDNFGFVYQDVRPGRESSYSRIGWHTDWQSSPHLAMWPSTAVTIHIDATSPANGFLRVVPGSQMWATPAPFENVNGAVVPDGSAPSGGYGAQPPPQPMPLGFDKVRGEMALYSEAGDVLFHDAYLWHSAAVATVESSRRCHVRGGWFAGERPSRLGPDDFVKNAAR